MRDLEIAMRVIREQRYHSLKGTKWKKGRSSRSLNSFVRKNYAASAIAFGSFSVVLSVIRYLETPSALGFAEADAILFFYLLMTNAYNAVFFLSQVKQSAIMEPVLHLPGVSIARVLTLANLYYYGTSTLFVVVPSFFMFALLFGQYLSLLVLVFWALLYTILGFCLGVIIMFIVSTRAGGSKSGSVRLVGGAIWFLGIVVVFVIFELWIYEPNLISPTIFYNPSILSSFLPVLEAVVTSVNPLSLHNVLYFPISATLYTVLTVALFRKTGYMLERVYLTGVQQKARTYRDTARRMRSGKYDKMFRKDLSILFRSPQNSVLVFLPLMLSLPALIPVMLARSGSPLSLYYLALSLPVMSASFYPLVTLISEGKAISLLFSLPIKKTDFLISKVLVSGTIFLVISAGIIIFAGLYIGENIVLIAFTEFCILAGYIYASMINFVRNSSKITDQVTILNLDSFGGTFGIMLTFGLTMILLLAPVLSGSLVAYMKFGNFSDNFFILGLDTVMNAFMLVATALLSLRMVRSVGVATFSS